jgi:single-stranded DNA-binding protein
MIFALISGQLFRNPKSCTSKGGRAYTAATVKISDATGSQFVRIMAWSDHARAELEPLQDGAALSISGKLEAQLYAPNGAEPRVSLSIIADQVLVLKKPARKKEAPETSGDKPKSSRMRRIGDGSGPPAAKSNFADDEISF